MRPHDRRAVRNRTRAVRPGAAGDPRRGELAGAGVPGRSGGTPYFVARAEGAVRLGRRGPALRRPRPVLRRHHPRPRPPGRRGGGAAGRPAAARATAPRPSARCCWPRRSCDRVPASRGPPGVAAAPRRRCRPSGWPGAPPAATEGREVRRQLPRPRRPLLAEAAAAWPRSGLAGSAGVTDGAVADTLVVPYNVVPELDERRRLRDRRAGGRQHGPRRRRRPGSSRACGPSATGSAPCSSSTRSSPASGWRRAAPRSGSASAPTCDARQGHRRRAAGRRLRRPGRRHGRRWPRSGPCTRRARCRGTRWPPRPAWPCSTRSTTPPTTTLEPTGPRGWPARLGGGRRGGPARCRCPGSGRCVGLYLGRDRAGRTTTTARGHRRRPLRPVVPRPARPRAWPWRPAPTRSLFPGAGPHATTSSTRSSTARRCGRRLPIAVDTGRW